LEVLLTTAPPMIAKANVGDNATTAKANIGDDDPANDHRWLQTDDVQPSTTTPPMSHCS
jgi:hypothetical protein